MQARWGWGGGGGGVLRNSGGGTGTGPLGWAGFGERQLQEQQGRVLGKSEFTQWLGRRNIGDGAER